MTLDLEAMVRRSMSAALMAQTSIESGNFAGVGLAGKVWDPLRLSLPAELMAVEDDDPTDPTRLRMAVKAGIDAAESIVTELTLTLAIVLVRYAQDTGRSVDAAAGHLIACAAGA